MYQSTKYFSRLKKVLLYFLDLESSKSCQKPAYCSIVLRKIIISRVTFKIEAREFHQTIQTSLHSKTYLLYNYAKLKHCTIFRRLFIMYRKTAICVLFQLFTTGCTAQRWPKRTQKFSQ